MRQKQLNEMDYFELLDALCWAENMSKISNQWNKPNDYYKPLREEIQAELRMRKVKGALEQFWRAKGYNPENIT